ncbi:MAG TPA: hypothetical protein PLC88_05100 [Syntrophomonas sp.]|nr:hypothetical protein [Syntrophomonas sp.]HRW12357.1 hypothetical protein [Syntrophomonas sp.]
MDNCCQGNYQDHCHDDCHHHGHFPFPFPGLKRPYVLVASIPRNRQIGVSPKTKAIKLVFAKDYTTRGLVDVDYTIDMWQGWKQIPITIRRTIDKKTGRRVWLVIPLVPLKGGVTYKIRIKSVLIFCDGTKVSKCKLIVFTTGCR